MLSTIQSTWDATFLNTCAPALQPGVTASPYRTMRWSPLMLAAAYSWVPVVSAQVVPDFGTIHSSSDPGLVEHLDEAPSDIEGFSIRSPTLM